MTVLQAWECTLPVRIVSVANLREHWATKARRTREQRATARICVRAEIGPAAPAGLYRVTITRQGGKRLDPHDNLPMSCKAIVDGIAEAMGIDDGSPCIEWVYAQGSAPRGRHSARVRIERVSAEGV